MKSKLKESMLERRNLLSKEWVMEKSSQIKSRLFGLEQYKNSSTIMFFVSFDNEVHTHEMIKEALKNKTVVVPRVSYNHSHAQIEPSVIISLDNLVASGKFGILQPIETMGIACKNIDMVLVPGIAFDEDGHRVGYGFGYYDKFLCKAHKAVKIGLAFDFQIVDKTPREGHDIPVDMIVTEKRVIDLAQKKH